MCNRGHDIHHNVGSRSNWLLCYSLLVLTLLLVGGLGSCEAAFAGEKETPVARKNGEVVNKQNTISDAVSSRLLPNSDMDDALLSMASYLPTVIEVATDSPTSEPSFAPTTNNSDAPTYADLPSISPTFHPSPGPTTTDMSSTTSPTISTDSSGCNNSPSLGVVFGVDLRPFVGTVLMALFFIVRYY